MALTVKPGVLLDLRCAANAAPQPPLRVLVHQPAQQVTCLAAQVAAAVWFGAVDVHDSLETGRQLRGGLGLDL